MKGLARFVEASCVLALAHLLVRFAHISRLERMLAAVPSIYKLTPHDHERAVRETCIAVRRAKRYYMTDVTCLPSAATCTSLLRLRGLPATLTIGVKGTPFEAHAWTELNGEVINDDPAVTSGYTVIKKL